MVLFIFFNDIGTSVDEWKKHPHDSSIKSNLLNKLKKMGNVYIYNPIFYNFKKYDVTILNQKYNDEIVFNLDQLNLKSHCKKLFTEVYKLDNEFVLIAQSDGHILAHTFASMYKENVNSFISINGTQSKEFIKMWLEKDQMKFIKKIKNKNLNELFDNLKNKRQTNDTIELLEIIVRYHMYKQYNEFTDLKLECQLFLFISIDQLEKLESLNKIKFNNEISTQNEKVKTFLYLNKTKYLYYDIEKNLHELLKKIVSNISILQI